MHSSPRRLSASLSTCAHLPTYLATHALRLCPLPQHTPKVRTLSTYGLPLQVWRSLPLELRYHTPAADLYRRRLQAMLDGIELPTEMVRLKPPPQRAKSLPTHPPLGAAKSWFFGYF